MRFRSVPNWLLIGVVATMLFPATVQAHLVTTGLGPVYDGIGHFVLTPEDFLPVIALALFAGLRGARAGRWVLFMLPAAWLAGGLMGLTREVAAPFPVPAISILLGGLLVATDLRLPPFAAATLAGIIGIIHGFLNVTAMRPPGSAALALLGVMVSVFTILALGSASVIAARRPWARIVVRVAGSWIAAIGLLLLGWTLRPKHNHVAPRAYASHCLHEPAPSTPAVASPAQDIWCQ